MCYLHKIHNSLTEFSALNIDTEKKNYTARCSQNGLSENKDTYAALSYFITSQWLFLAPGINPISLVCPRPSHLGCFFLLLSPFLYYLRIVSETVLSSWKLPFSHMSNCYSTFRSQLQHYLVASFLDAVNYVVLCGSKTMHVYMACYIFSIGTLRSQNYNSFLIAYLPWQTRRAGIKCVLATIISPMSRLMSALQ